MHLARVMGVENWHESLLSLKKDLLKNSDNGVSVNPNHFGLILSWVGELLSSSSNSGIAEQISRIQQDHDHQESTLWAYQEDELPRLQLQAENEMREKPSALRKEHEIQMKSLKMQHEDDYKKLQDELELEKSKEEKHRALRQLQWKEYSVSSIKMRDPYGGKENKLALASPESRRKDASSTGLKFC